MDPEIRIRELLKEINGCNEQAHCAALIRLRKVLERQKSMLDPVLKRELIRALYVIISPYGKSITTPAEAVRCLGTNVLWDRVQKQWLDQQRHIFQTPSLLPVQEAINAVFLQQRMRRNNVKEAIHKIAVIEE
jgi:hypothetical protein